MAHASSVLDRGIVNHYRILSQLASGGMGVIYRAFDTQLERTVALKFVTPDPDCSVADREQLLREARSAANLDHKNIANIHAVEETPDGQLFIVMAFYEGESLASKMAEGPIKTEEAVRIVREIAEGLSHAHAHDVIHRDVKPSNVILTTEGEIKIVDFGLARFTRSDAATQSLNIAGTLTYMSPELLSGMAVDARSDIWSLGVIAYQLFTHHAPFKERNPAAMVHAILHAPPEPMIGVPGDLQLIVHRALAKNTADRYQSCSELLRDLNAIESGESIPQPRRSLDYPLISAAAAQLREISRHTLTLFAILCVIFFGGLAVWNLIPTSPGKTQPTIQAASPAAYESYLRGTEFLKKKYRPGMLDEAEMAFKQTVQSDPRFALGHVGLAEAYWEKYRQFHDPRFIDLARASTSTALALNDQLPATHVILGRIQAGTSHADLALQEFQRALDLEPLNPSALLGLGNTYASLHRDREAEEALKKVISLRPDDWTAYADLGAIYYALRRYREAADTFKSELELVPDNATAHSSLGTSLLADQKVSEAETEFKNAVSLAPDYIAYSNLGVIYFNQKRYVDAASMTEKALEITDKDYRLWYNLALTYELLGKKESAARARTHELEQLETIAPLQVNDPTIHSHLAMQYAARGMAKKARLQLAAAIALAPNDADVNASAGVTYELLGDRPRALEYLNLAIKNGATIEDLQIDPALQSIFADPKMLLALQQTATKATK